MLYDHRKKEDLDALANALSDATTQQKALLCAYCLADRLMTPRGLGLRFVVFVSKLKNREKNGLHVLYQTFLNEKLQGAVEDLWTQTLAHMRSGKDSSDPTSAGGWNRVELNAFVNNAKRCGALRDDR